MKVIEGDIITLAKVKCAVCYDDHFFKIVRDRNRDEFNEMYYFEFIEKYWPTLKDRIRLIKNFINHEISNVVSLNMHQIEELYDLLRNDVLDEKDKNSYFHIKKIDISEENRNYHFPDKKGYFNLQLFKNDEGFIAEAEFSINRKGNILLESIDIGWCSDLKMFNKKDKLKFILNFLFKRSKYPFIENSFSITKEEARILLPILAGLIKYHYEMKNK